MSAFDDDNFDGPPALREAYKKLQKELEAERKARAEAEKKAAEGSLAKIFSDKKVPANIQRWMKRDEVEATEAAVDKWLNENGADFGWKPGAVEASEDATSEEAPAQAATPAQESVLTPELVQQLTQLAEVFGPQSGQPFIPADQMKAKVDDVAANINLGHESYTTDATTVVRMLAEAGVPIESDIKF